MAGLTLETMRILVLVAFSSFVTEWLCSLQMEIKYIWKSKFCLLSACFLGARYITMANLSLMVAMFYGQWTADACNRLYLAMPILATLGMLCAEGVCCIRIWTIHKRNPIVLSMLGIFLSATACIQSYAITNYVAFREGGSCVAAGRGLWLSFYWIAPAILDMVILGLAMIAVAQETRKFGRNRLLNVILRDQVLYFFLVFSACVISGVLMGSQSSYLQSLNNPPAITVSSIGATRIVLSLKKEGSRVQSSHHGRYQTSSAEASTKWHGKKGILSWWTTASSSNHEKGLSSTSMQVQSNRNNKSWLHMSASSPITSVETPVKWVPNSPLDRSGARDLELGAVSGQQSANSCDVVQVLETAQPPAAHQKKSAVFFTKERNRPTDSSLGIESTTTPTDATTLTSIAEHGHDNGQPRQQSHPYAGDRLIGLGDTTKWKAQPGQSTSAGVASSSMSTVACPSQNSAGELPARTVLPPGAPRFKPWTHKGHASKSGDFTGLAPQYNGCFIRTETTTSVSRGSLVGPPTPRAVIDELTDEFPSPPLSGGFVTGLPQHSRDDHESSAKRDSRGSHSSASTYDQVSAVDEDPSSTTRTSSRMDP